MKKKLFLYFIFCSLSFFSISYLTFFAIASHELLLAFADISSEERLALSAVETLVLIAGRAFVVADLTRVFGMVH